MAVVIANDFEDESTGSLPSTDAGTWAQAGDGLATVETLGDGRALRVPSTVDDNCIPRYTFPAAIASGIVYCYFKMRRSVNNLAFFGGMIYGEGVPVARIGMENDSYFYCIVDSSAEALYTEAGHATLAKLGYVADTTYSCRIMLDMSDQTAYMWIDSVPVGYDDDGAWQSSIPFENTVSSVNRFFASINAGAITTNWIDDLYITSQDAQDTAPTRGTLISPFTLDTATVVSYKGATTPNRASTTLDGSNVLTDSVGRPWYSADCTVGDHRLRFDFGSGVTKILRHVSIFNHNLDSFTLDGGGSITGIRFIGFNDSVSGWLSPVVQVDLLAQKMLDPMVAWIPTHTACRYYAMEITISVGTLTSIDNITIGRVVGAVASEIWTPARDFGIDYDWTDTDPSIITEMEGGNRQARVKNPQRQVSIQYPFLPIEEQETLRTNFRLSGGHDQWVLMLDPTNEPQDYTVLGYIQDSLGLKRGYREGAQNVAITILETVE